MDFLALYGAAKRSHPSLSRGGWAFGVNATQHAEGSDRYGGVERRTEQRTGNREQRTNNGRGRKGDDIAERLLDAVEGIRKLLPALDADAAAKHVAKQLWRSASGGGANYEEARGAESCADFVHKIRIASKELREAHYWLRIVQRSDWIEHGAADSLASEIDQLIAILMASAGTAKSRMP